MEPIYRYSESSVKPAELEKGKRTVFMRKDIVEEDRTDAYGNPYTCWVYQEAKMSHDEFAKYSDFISAKNAIKGVNDSENISQLMAGQENGDNNQLIIMEAIADLYDVIAMLM